MLKTLFEDTIAKLSVISQEAGSKILSVYESDQFEIELKSDQSPITRADRLSNDLIVKGLKESFPKIPLLSEESAMIAYSERSKWDEYWLIDPLDGTKEFINRSGDFTVNIALVRGGCPVLGIVYVPLTGEIFYGAKRQGAFTVKKGGKAEPISVRSANEKNLVAFVSRTHPGKETQSLKEVCPSIHVQPMGSSLKFCKVAEGLGDIYLRLKPTMEWDSAAAQAVVEAAGGKVLQLNSRPLEYNKEDLLNPSFVVVGSDLDWQRFIQ